jgi:DNA invertase Pin-like site-specific DNA recombinase
LVVTKLDRLARSLPDACDSLDGLTKRNVKLPSRRLNPYRTDCVGRLLFNVLAMVAGFESDLIRLRTREGMKIAKAKGRLRGRHPKLKTNQVNHLLELHDSVPDHAAQGLALQCASVSASGSKQSLRGSGP